MNYSSYPLRPDRVPGEEPLPYVRGKKKILIFGIVILFHAAVIGLPLLFLAVSDMLNPPHYVMRLPVVESIPDEDLEMPAQSAPGRQKSTGVPDYGMPEQVENLPALPEPAPAKPQPAAPEKTKPAAPANQKPPPKKTKPTVREKPQKKPKSRYLSSREIKVSNKHVTRRSSRDYRAMAEREARAARAEQERRAAARALLGLSGAPGGSGGPRDATSKEFNDYYNAVESYLKRRWEQPAAAALNGARPVVTLRLKVDGSGRLLAAEIVRRSGVAAMDASVERLVALIQAQRVLPTPPREMEFTVRIEINR